MTSVTIDVAGGAGGGAGRMRGELLAYLARSKRPDVHVLGDGRRLDSRWLVQRELHQHGQARQVALNNVSFVGPGGERWTLLGNALHFLTQQEKYRLHPSLRSVVMMQGPVVRLAAQRSDVLVAPCSAMAERVAAALPGVAGRIRVRMHPVTSRPARPAARAGDSALVLCPVLFAPYKHMPQRLAEWVTALGLPGSPPVRLVVTARPADVPGDIIEAATPVELVGEQNEDELRGLWQRARAVFFPPGLESFGFPLAEARANGQPVIARDTEQNREIAGPALCGYTVGDADSLRAAVYRALTMSLAPDPGPFDPDRYFDWLLSPLS
jgi:glycosyltransferase involved in cell wall biosynthesis